MSANFSDLTLKHFLAAIGPSWVQAARHQGDMTARVILTKVLQQGKNLVQNVLLKTQKQPTVKAIRNVKQVRRADAELKPEPWQRFSQGSRWYRSYYNTVASRLRRQAAWGVGRSTVLAFAGGLTLTSQQQQDSEIVQLIRVRVSV